jgi:hypothetical protein
MKAYSASEAISPAIERTKRYLFEPFDWGMYLKLSAVACITEGFSANLNLHSHHSSPLPSGGSPMLHLPAEIIAAIIAVALLGLVIGIIVFYLITRLRFAFFHCLAHKTKLIRPAWTLYRAQAMRLFKASLVVWFAFLAILALVLLPFFFTFFELIRNADSGGHFDVLKFLLTLLPLIAVVIVLSLLAYGIDVVMRDFMLPHMALENSSFGQAWAAVRPRIGAEKGTFFIYLFLRAVLPFVAMIGVFIVAAIPLFIVFGALGLAGMGFHAALANGTGVIALFRIAIEIMFGVTGAGLGLLVAFSLGGPVATWVRNYALLFYGGRYAALGEILYPNPAPPSAFVGQPGW